MKNFKELDVGDVFRTNLMYFQKIQPQERTDHEDDRRIRVNAKFLSDDHYEANKTDIYKSSAPVWIADSREVQVADGNKLRAVSNEKTKLN